MRLLEAVGRPALPHAAYGVAFDGANIWIAKYGSDNMTKLRASDGALLATAGIPVEVPNPNGGTMNTACHLKRRFQPALGSVESTGPRL